MKIGDRFLSGKTQAELDFVNIDTDRDTPLFLDPFFLGLRKDRWSVSATLTIKSFFQKIIDLIIAGDMTRAKDLFLNLREENSTCLGVSAGNPEGKGVGDQDAVKIFDSLLKSKAIQTGLIQDIEDNILFIEYFGKDKLSDMTTNIIKEHLINYTQAQCQLQNIPLTNNLTSGHFWSRNDNSWNSKYTEMLVIDGKPILLVPKAIVSYSKAYTPDNYYNHFVLNFLQNEHLRISSALVKETKGGRKFVTKKDLKEAHPPTKDFLRKFTLDHPEVLEEFKKQKSPGPLTNNEISDISIQQVCKTVGTTLVSIPSGTQTASAFHNLIVGILELIFYPNLINPVKEREIHEGRKRIDISFDNAAKDGIFYRLSENMNLPCPYLFVECKNYSSDPANPELDQLSGRFSVNRGRVGILVCRNFDNKEKFIKRCRDTFKDGRGLIIPLADQDLINLLDNHNEYNNSFTEKYISDLVRTIVID